MVGKLSSQIIGHSYKGGRQFVRPYPDASLFIDDLTPVISSAESDPTSSDPIPIDIVFNREVIGLKVGDIIIGGGTASNLSGSGKTYSFDLNPVGYEVKTVDIPINVCADAENNYNVAAAQFSIEYILAVIVTDNLMTWIDPENPSCWNAGTPDTLIDLSGNAINAILIRDGGTAEVQDDEGTNIIRLYDRAAITWGNDIPRVSWQTNKWSIEMWVKHDNVDRLNDGGFARGSIFGNGRSYTFQIPFSSGVFCGITDTDDVNIFFLVDGTGRISTINDAYRLYGFVFDCPNEIVKFYINGVFIVNLEPNNSVGTIPDWVKFYLGDTFHRMSFGCRVAPEADDDWLYGLRGRVGACRYYKDELTADEFLNNFNTDKEQYGL